MKNKWLALSALALSAAAANAQTERASVTVGSNIGTDGASIDMALPVTPYVDLRLGGSFGRPEFSSTQEGIDYDATVRFSSARLVLDLKPNAGAFRITAGLYTSAPDIDLEANGQDDYEIGGRVFRADLNLDSDVDLGGAAPYLGIGWGGTNNTRGWGLSADLGVMFTQSPEVSVRASGIACDATLDPGCSPAGPEGFDVNSADPRAIAFQNELERERQDLEDKADDYRFWPVLRVGINYRF
ncbi:MAG: hypothetical protein ACPGZP_05860 [Panacagrimonas sp.]